MYVASYGGNALQILKAQFDTNSPFLYPKFPIHYSNLTHIINGFSVEL
ncbi:MAG: hypothetical protein LBU14_02740 [Candidatus Peribacteria bacterium]|nr:hypothetical protein [Candidatus Peribacteria bacterium]